LIAKQLNPDWYRIKYNLAALHANWAALDEGESSAPDEQADHRKEAHSGAKELAEAALEQLVEGTGKADPALLTLLEKSILPSALILYSGTAQDPEKGEQHFYAERTPGNLEQLLADMRTGLSPEHAFGFVASAKRPTARTLYNLACAAAQAGDTTAAESYLQRALSSGSEAERRQLAQRSAVDPTLRPLSVDDIFGDISQEDFRTRAQEAAQSLVETLRSRIEEAGAQASAEAEEAESSEAEEEEEEENGPAMPA
jgi:hypothetical protein